MTSTVRCSRDRGPLSVQFATQELSLSIRDSIDFFTNVPMCQDEKINLRTDCSEVASVCCFYIFFNLNITNRMGC